jgi:hypothetical protein
MLPAKARGADTSWMLWLAVVVTAAGLALGLLGAHRLLPVPATDGEGRLADWCVRVLIGAACGLAALYIYIAIHDFASIQSASGITGPGGAPNALNPRADIFISAAESILYYSGVLLALATVIYYLAPDRPENR